MALGWYATVIAAVLVGRAGIPVAPDRDCAAVFSCMTPGQEVILLMIIAGPVLVALLIITLPVTALLARWVSSSIVTGTLAALGSVVAAAAVGMLWHGGR
ncbi:hypothetical protein [Micromonospora sonchi]|nr:hypothetical protein [Micromonospora sonchi]